MDNKLSEWDEGFKAGFEMAGRLIDKRMTRMEKTFLQAMAWLVGSPAGLHIPEFQKLEEMLGVAVKP